MFVAVVENHFCVSFVIDLFSGGPLLWENKWYLSDLAKHPSVCIIVDVTDWWMNNEATSGVASRVCGWFVALLCASQCMSLIVRRPLVCLIVFVTGCLTIPVYAKATAKNPMLWFVWVLYYMDHTCKHLWLYCSSWKASYYHVFHVKDNVAAVILRECHWFIISSLTIIQLTSDYVALNHNEEAIST